MTRKMKLALDDPQREFEFDLDYLLSLTSAERYAIMLRRSTDALERMIRHGYLPATEIIKRPARPIRRRRSQRVSHSRLSADDRRH